MKEYYLIEKSIVEQSIELDAIHSIPADDLAKMHCSAMQQILKGNRTLNKSFYRASKVYVDQYMKDLISGE